MRAVSIVFCIFILSGCLSPKTLKERETWPRVQEDLELENPTWAYLNSLTNEIKTNVDISIERKSSNSAVLPVVNTLLGRIWNLGDLAGSFGMGLGMDFLNWSSKENTLARIQWSNISNLYKPVVLFYTKEAEEDYESLFLKVDEYVKSAMEGEGECNIRGYLEETQYRAAESFHVPGKFHYRRYKCDNSLTMQRTIFELYSRASTDTKFSSEAFLNIIRLSNIPTFKYRRIEFSFKPDMQFELYSDYKDKFPNEWVRFFNAHDKAYNYKWMCYLENNNARYIVEPLSFPLEKDNLKWINVLENRQRLFQNQ